MSKTTEGLVLQGANNAFTVLADDGSVRLCPIKGKRFKDITGSYNSLAAGDRVELLPDPADPRKGLVSALLPRRNVFGRFNEKGRANQSIAANIDLVVCVASPFLPPFRPRFIDRVAVLAEAASVPLLIVLNKADLGVDDAINARLGGYRALGYESITTSIPDRLGLDALRPVLLDKTSVFIGQSGVGKSSLLNAIEPGLGLKTDRVSEKYERGRHTTTLARLFQLDDARTRIIDTPGFRRLALRGIDPDGLDAYFPELARLSPLCSFGLSCGHVDESGCRVLAALASGEVLADRYESYLRIREELERNEGYSPREGRHLPPEDKRGDGARKARRLHRAERDLIEDSDDE